MKRMLKLLFLCTVLAPIGGPLAQGFPSKAITFVVPYAPGGTNDIIARAVAATMTTSVGQPVWSRTSPEQAAASAPGSSHAPRRTATRC